MRTQLSRKWAIINVIIVAIFYLISGVWEILVGETQGTGFGGGPYYLMEVHKSYLIILGRATFFVGLGLLFRLNLARLLAIILAWLNLFTAPIAAIWWDIYIGNIKKALAVDWSFESIIYRLIFILTIIAIRLYIIYIFNVSKAGHIFLRKNKDEHTGA